MNFNQGQNPELLQNQAQKRKRPSNNSQKRKPLINQQNYQNLMIPQIPQNDSNEWMKNIYSQNIPHGIPQNLLNIIILFLINLI